ncbi:MAG: hypothetical protein PHO02_01555 [Candidatus Nanoarchaeia archaeon]|nr:hypothetical protein [Candidatus Nanoarchaeia archaeon]
MNKYVRGILIGAGLAAAALYSPGCKGKDEPIVVHPRVSCCHRDCDNDSNTIRIQYVKPAQGNSVKQNYTRPQLSRHNPFNDSDARQNAERLIERRRANTPQLSGHNPFEENGRPRVTGSSYGSGSGSAAGCSGNYNADPCYDTSRTPAERGRACAARLPTADEVFGHESQPSLEQRLRDCERQNAEIRQLNSELEEQIDSTMVPPRGRG